MRAGLERYPSTVGATTRRPGVLDDVVETGDERVHAAGMPSDILHDLPAGIVP